MAERLNMVDGSMAQQLDGLEDPWLSSLTGWWLGGSTVDGLAARQLDNMMANLSMVRQLAV
jgi:hypothetical protein